MIAPATAFQNYQTNAGAKAAGRHAVFRRQEQLFGLTIDLVREVLPGQSLTRVPRAQEQILGVLSLRGEILPVVVIDRWLGLPILADNLQQPILVLRRGELLVGLRVDAIQSVVTIPPQEIQPHPANDIERLLAGIWQPSGQNPITLISDTVLVDMLCQDIFENP